MSIKEEVAKEYGDKVRIRVCGFLREENQVLLVKHVYKHNNESFWAPPGGGLEFGESVHDCLKREFSEETELTIEVKDFICVNEFLAPPLHAIELFFQVERESGSLRTGSDPEMKSEAQIIKKASFIDINDVLNSKDESYHPVLEKILNTNEISPYFNKQR